MAQDGDDPTKMTGEILLLAQQAIVHSLVLAMQNAVAAQQMMNTLTVAIAGQVADQKTDARDSGLRAALDVLREHDPVAQMAQLAALIQQMQKIIVPVAEVPVGP
jgi:hypothetical protein